MAEYFKETKGRAGRYLAYASKREREREREREKERDIYTFFMATLERYHANGEIMGRNGLTHITLL